MTSTPDELASATRELALAALHEMLSALEASLADMPLPSNGQAEDDDASL